MNISKPGSAPGRVASLHLHPDQPGAPLKGVTAVAVVAGNGVVDDLRYFGRPSKDSRQPNHRQVSLIEREMVAEHAGTLGLQAIDPGAVRANIETTGINLVGLVGSEIQIGDAILFIGEPRKPCAKMDAICTGLRQLMMDGRQGVLAEVVQTGKIRVGDPISVRSRKAL